MQSDLKHFITLYVKGQIACYSRISSPKEIANLLQYRTMFCVISRLGLKELVNMIVNVIMRYGCFE